MRATSRATRAGATPGEPPGHAALTRLAVGAAGWSFANTVVVRLLTLASGILLARILAPEDFGVLAAALVLFNIVISVSEMGVSVALVRTVGDISRIAPTVVSISLASSVGLLGVCWCAAPWYAAWTGVPEASDVVRLLALSLPFAGLSAVPGAITQRDFRQDRKAVAEVLGAVVGIVVAVVLALHGAGVWSLAWQRVASVVTSSLVLCVGTPERYLPGWDRRVARDVLGLGLPLAGSSLVVLAAMNVDYLVVGRVLGVEALGFYLVAFNLSSWPVAVFSAPARNVSVTWFSHLRELGGDSGRGLGLLLQPLLLAAVPVCLLLSVSATPLLRLLYGREWVAAAVPLAVLAALGVGRVLVEAGYDLLVSLGRGTTILRTYLLWLVVLVPALWAGAEVGGLAGVSWAQVLVLFVVVVPALVRALHVLGIGVGGVGRALVVPLGSGLALLVAALVARGLVHPHSDLAELAVLGCAGGGAYVLAALALRRSTASWIHGAGRGPGGHPAAAPVLVEGRS